MPARHCDPHCQPGLARRAPASLRSVRPAACKRHVHGSWLSPPKSAWRHGVAQTMMFQDCIVEKDLWTRLVGITVGISDTLHLDSGWNGSVRLLCLKAAAR